MPYISHSVDIPIKSALIIYQYLEKKPRRTSCGGKQMECLWIRKVDVSANPGFKAVLDEVRQKDRIPRSIVLKYRGRGGLC